MRRKSLEYQIVPCGCTMRLREPPEIARFWRQDNWMPRALRGRDGKSPAICDFELWPNRALFAGSLAICLWRRRIASDCDFVDGGALRLASEAGCVSVEQRWTQRLRHCSDAPPCEVSNINIFVWALGREERWPLWPRNCLFMCQCVYVLFLASVTNTRSLRINARLQKASWWPTILLRTKTKPSCDGQERWVSSKREFWARSPCRHPVKNIGQAVQSLEN